MRSSLIFPLDCIGMRININTISVPIVRFQFRALAHCSFLYALATYLIKQYAFPLINKQGLQTVYSGGPAGMLTLGYKHKSVRDMYLLISQQDSR